MNFFIVDFLCEKSYSIITTGCCLCLYKITWSVKLPHYQSLILCFVFPIFIIFKLLNFNIFLCFWRIFKFSSCRNLWVSTMLSFMETCRSNFSKNLTKWLREGAAPSHSHFPLRRSALSRSHFNKHPLGERVLLRRKFPGLSN